MSASDEILTRAAAVLSEVADGCDETVSNALIQAALAAVTRAYTTRIERGDKLAAFSHDAVSATAVAITTSAMLDAANIGIFELSMWQSLKSPPTAT